MTRKKKYVVIPQGEANKHSNHVSPVVKIKERLAEKRKSNRLIPRNLSQETYLLTLNNPKKNIVFAIGSAGTGKTGLACQWAIDQLQAGLYDKIIITRPAVSVDEDIGFLPGSIEEKMAPWLIPILDFFGDTFEPDEIKLLIDEGIIVICPLAFIRGRTFKNSIVIADEQQNSTPSQMKALLTRIGENSKMIVTGDLKQADKPSCNGLLQFLELYNRFENSIHVSVCKFAPSDIERHPAVKEILAIYGDLD
jgi:phosphate starvation-inducible PhoH-like protein